MYAALSECLAGAQKLSMVLFYISMPIIAVFGLSTWNREHKGKESYQTAKQLLVSVYKLRRAMKLCRSPMVFASEFPDDYDRKVSSKPLPEEEARAWGKVYQKRWEVVIGALDFLDESLLDAEAIWGGDIIDRVKKLQDCASELNGSLHAIVLDKAHSGENFRSDKEFGENMRGIASETSAAPSKRFTEKMDTSIVSIETFAKPYITKYKR